MAVPIAEAARADVAAVVDAIRATEPPGRGVRWVRLDGLHVTLRFLGPTSAARIGDLAAAVEAAAASTGAFPIRLHGAGSFPPVGRPRTLWVAIDEGADQLAALAASLDRELVRAGWPASERPFRAHLTLARADGVRAGPRTAEELRLAAEQLDAVSTVDRIVVFESVTGGGPARYLPRVEARLGVGDAVLPSPGPRDGLRNRRQGAHHTS